MEKITAVVTEAVAAMVAGGASDEVIYAEVDAAIAKLPVAGRLLPGASARQMVANAIAAARHADPAIVALDEHQRPPAGQGRAP